MDPLLDHILNAGRDRSGPRTVSEAMAQRLRIFIHSPISADTHYSLLNINRTILCGVLRSLSFARKQEPLSVFLTLKVRSRLPCICARLEAAMVYTQGNLAFSAVYTALRRLMTPEARPPALEGLTCSAAEPMATKATYLS
jgi:hypothetical protein